MILDFVIEIELPAVTLAAREPAARFGAPPEQPVEIGELRGTETPGEARARQSHELAERAHTHRREPRVFFLGPAQHFERQRFEPCRQLARIGDETARARACRRERGERRGSERETRLQPRLRE